MASDLATVHRAATVVLLRAGRHRGADELYMLRRSSRSPFMPDAMVFPGGVLEAIDGDPASDETFIRAARRECLEEAGIDLVHHELRWFDTWQTPRGESLRRYLARFYLVRLAADEGAEARPDGRETTAGRWARAAEFLEAWRDGDIDLPVPTLCVLAGLAERGADHLLARETDALQLPIVPRLKLPAPGHAPRGEGVLVLLPHDPEFEELPGEPFVAPSRAREHPPRFRREANRWRPC